MKNSYKLALLAVLGLASVTAVQAQSDLIIGVYQSGVANTEVVDLGSVSSLVSGQTWNLSSSLTSAGFSSTLATTAQFGLAGYNNGGAAPSASTLYATYKSGTSILNSSYAVGSDSGFNGDVNAVQSVPLGAQTAGTPAGWDQQVLPANSGSLGASLGFNVNNAVTKTANFWSLVDDNSAPTEYGTFALNPNTEVLTFTATAVPEPTTYGLVAGAGLLIVSLRNKLTRKQA